jgi:hypothetical protein
VRRVERGVEGRSREKNGIRRRLAAPAHLRTKAETDWRVLTRLEGLDRRPILLTRHERLARRGKNDTRLNGHEAAATVTRDGYMRRPNEAIATGT